MKKLTNVIFIINFLLTIYYIYLHLNPFIESKIYLGILSIILLIAPIFVEKICKFKIEKYIKLIYYFFLLIAFILGGLFGLYYSTSYFDLFVHGIFGLLLSIIIGTKIKVKSIKDLFLILLIVLFISFLWEVIEFLGDNLFGTDHQEKISGATDTMTDILISWIGVASYSIYLFFMNKIKQ